MLPTSLSLVSVPGVTLPVLRGEATPCPYLPDRQATSVYWLGELPDPDTYQALMDRGFRRSGQVVYANLCPSCRECVPIRVPVEHFAPSKSQRRVRRRNQDLAIRFAPPYCDASRLELYNRYQAQQHGDTNSYTAESYAQFLAAGGENAVEMSYWLNDRLVAVGLVDVCAISASSVYFYFDPDHAQRSLGVFSALREIEECRARSLPYWYAGYYVRGCGKMTYKRDYRPHEFLHPDGVWRPNHPAEHSVTQ